MVIVASFGQDNHVVKPYSQQPAAESENTNGPITALVVSMCFLCGPDTKSGISLIIRIKYYSYST